MAVLGEDGVVELMSETEREARRLWALESSFCRRASSVCNERSSVVAPMGVAWPIRYAGGVQPAGRRVQQLEVKRLSETSTKAEIS